MNLELGVALFSVFVVVLGFAVNVGRQRELQERFRKSHERHYELSDKMDATIHELDKRVAILEDRGRTDPSG